MRHSLFEDAYAYLTGCSFVVLGMMWLKSAGLVTGGIAGLALLISYIVPLPAGVLFTLLNIPFFVFAGRELGRSVIFRAIVANLVISGLAIIAPLAFRIEGVNAILPHCSVGRSSAQAYLSWLATTLGWAGLGCLQSRCKSAVDGMPVIRSLAQMF